MALVVTSILVALAAPADVQSVVTDGLDVQVDDVSLHVAARREELGTVGAREGELAPDDQRLNLRPVRRLLITHSSQLQCPSKQP